MKLSEIVNQDASEREALRLLKQGKKILDVEDETEVYGADMEMLIRGELPELVKTQEFKDFLKDVNKRT